MKKLLTIILCSLLFAFTQAQQADSDKKDSPGHARPAINSTVLKQKPVSDLKKDVASVKGGSAPQQPKASPSPVPLASEKKN